MLNRTYHFTLLAFSSSLLLSNAILACGGQTERDRYVDPNGTQHGAAAGMGSAAGGGRAGSSDVGGNGANAGSGADAGGGFGNVAGAGGTNSVQGVVRLLGQTDHSGAKVTFTPLGLTTQTDAEGRFRFESVPLGEYSIEIERGDHHELVPHFTVSSDGSGIPFEGSLYALDPIEVPRARRLVSSSNAYLASNVDPFSFHDDPRFASLGGTSYTWDTDGRIVLFTRSYVKDTQLYLGLLGNSAFMLGEPISVFHKFTLANGGARAAFMTKNSNGMTFNLFTADNPPLSLTSFAAKEFAISLAGDVAAVVTDRNGIERVDLKSGSRTELLPSGDSEPRALDLNAVPGSVVFYTGNGPSSTLQILPANGPLASIANVDRYSAEFAEDGSRVFYAQSNMFGLLHMSATKNPNPVWLSDQTQMTHLSRSKRTYFFNRAASQSGLRTLHDVAVASGVVSTIAQASCDYSSSGRGGCFRLEDDQLFYIDNFDANTKQGTLKRRPADGGESVTLMPRTSIPKVYWVPKSRSHIYYLAEETLCEVGFDGTGARKLATDVALIQDRYSDIFRFTNSGLIFKKRHEKSGAGMLISVLKLGGSSVELVSSVSSWKLSSDGSRVLAFTDKEAGGGTAMLRIVDLSTTQVQLIDAGELDSYYDFSPTGNGVIYLKSGTLYLNLDNRKFALGVASHLTHAKKSERLVFVSPDGIKLANLRDGSVVTLVPLTADSQLKGPMMLSPDESRVAFRIASGSGGFEDSLLYATQLDSGETQAVLSHATSFAWAGSYVVASRAVATTAGDEKKASAFSFQAGYYSTKAQ